MCLMFKIHSYCLCVLSLDATGSGAGIVRSNVVKDILMWYSYLLMNLNVSFLSRRLLEIRAKDL